MKTCSKCGQEKIETEFYRDKQRPDGLTYACGECRRQYFKKWYDANPALIKQIQTKNREKHKEYYSSPERKKKYRIRYIEKSFNISYHEYDKLYLEQSGLCAICNLPETSSKCTYLAVDHCHKTGKIRGLLCNGCNRALGMLGDTLAGVEKAVEYLRKNQ